MTAICLPQLSQVKLKIHYPEFPVPTEGPNKINYRDTFAAYEIDMGTGKTECNIEHPFVYLVHQLKLGTMYR